MKTKVSLIFSVTLLISLGLFFLPSCNNYDNALKKKIIKFSSDRVIDEKEYKELKDYVIAHSEYNDYERISGNDTLIVMKIKTLLKDTTVLIKSPIYDNVKLQSIQFYIETSASMGGYMNGKTKFKDIVLELVGNLQTTFQSIRFIPNTVMDTIRTYKDESSYRDSLSKSKFRFEGNSPLDKMFDVISTKGNIDDVCFLVTDAIMSGTNHQILIDREYNRTNNMLLKTDVQRIFSKLNEKFKGKYGVSVFAFKSNFNPGGRNPYYTYTNRPVPNSFKERPFYLFVFGHSDLVKQVIEKMGKIESFKPQEELHFGSGNLVTNTGVVFKSYLSNTEKGACIIQSDESVKCDITPSTSHPVKFAVGLNLENLPKYASEKSYLDSNVKVASSNRIVIKHSDVKQILQSLKQQLDQRKELPKILSNGCTHYVEVEVDDMFAIQDTIHISLLKKVNPWYEVWSTDNDQNIENDKKIQGQTFNFMYLINGFREAFKNDSNDYFFSIDVIITNSN